MGISALSMQIHSNQLYQSVDIAMVKKTMDVQENAAESLIETIKNIPTSSNIIDTYA